MTTQQNMRIATEANRLDVARLIAAGLAGQRSVYSDVARWSGREYNALMDAAAILLPLYQEDMMADEMQARLGRSMLDRMGS